MDLPVLTSAGSERAQRRTAGALAARGIAEGDRVVLSVPGSADYVSVVLGALRSGVVAVPVDPRLTDHERDAALSEVDPSLVVDSPDVLADLLEGPEHDIDRWPRSRPMHFTSGTTGRPKGVWSGLLAPDDAEALVREERELWGFTANDLDLVVSPVYHSAPLRFAMGTLLAGGSIAILSRFDAQAFADAVHAVRPTSMFCVPAHLQRLFAWLDDDPEHGLDTSSFRLVAHAGAPCPDHVRVRAHETFGLDVVWEFYGSTEGQFTACPAPLWVEHPGTLGTARPGRVVSVDDDLLWCAVPPWARFTYWRDPEKTAETWRDTPDGPAFTAGDLGRVEDGLVYLDARRTDLIISGGVNVYPAEVETALADAPGLDDIAVFGRPDERWGQRVCAAYVGDVSEEVLRALAAERLSPPKRPKDYRRVDALPRTATGKVRRTEL